MKFDFEQKVIIKTLNQTEAVAFIKFLRSEVIRHQRDIVDAERLIIQVRRMHNVQG